MFERFSRPARDAVVGAQVEARQLGHHQIGAAHVLLGGLGQLPTSTIDALAAAGVAGSRLRTPSPS